MWHPSPRQRLRRFATEASSSACERPPARTARRFPAVRRGLVAQKASPRGIVGLTSTIRSSARCFHVRRTERFIAAATDAGHSRQQKHRTYDLHDREQRHRLDGVEHAFSPWLVRTPAGEAARLPDPGSPGAERYSTLFAGSHGTPSLIPTAWAAPQLVSFDPHNAVHRAEIHHAGLSRNPLRQGPQTNADLGVPRRPACVRSLDGEVTRRSPASWPRSSMAGRAG
jgi:hypothetical protein